MGGGAAPALGFVNWRIIGFSSYEPDIQQLSAEDRLQLDEELFGWVAAGPPRRVNRTMFGVEGFEDLTSSGFRITYLVSEAEHYVAVLRVRKET